MVRYLFLLLLLTTSLFARSNYRGYSGAPGTNGTCATTCHGQDNGTVQISGFPESYVPDSTYLITIQAVSGASINNFNGSIRVGTGSTNAGTISGGTNTATHNVAGETNGIHLSANNRTSGTFSWHAPAAGTGSVTLYVGAFQGTNDNSGQNTSLDITASELVNETPPGLATNPLPAHGATNIDVALSALSWSAANRADSYEVFMGTVEPLQSLGSVTNTSITLSAALAYETIYLWRVDATNEFGTTTGTLWQFTTEAVPLPLPGLATNPYPADNATGVSIHVDTLSWSPADNATTYRVYMGHTQPLEPLITISDTLILVDANLPYNTTFMWRVDAENESGTTTGTTWSFTTEQQSPAHDAPLPAVFSVSPAYPNPFNNSSRVTLTLPLSSTAQVTIYDMLGREVSMLYRGQLPAGSHTLEWNATGHAAGLYVVRSTVNGATSSQNLIYLP